MTSDGFLTELQQRIGGRIDLEGRRQGVLGTAPRLYAEREGKGLLVDFISDGEVILEVQDPPPHRLCLRKENFVSRILGGLGIACDRKTGDAVFDQTYLIDNATQDWAQQALTGEVRELISQLEPLGVFELTNKEYRCLKAVDLDEYTPEHAQADLDAMVRIAEIVGEVGRAETEET